MSDDEVEGLLDVLWRRARGGDPADPAAALAAARGDAAVIAAARERALKQQRANELIATAESSSRRERRRAEADAGTYALIAEMCDKALEGDSRQSGDPANGQVPPVVLAPPLLAVEVVVALADRQWARLVRFTTIPRAGDRISVAPVAATVESVVWSLDTNDVAVPTAMCRVAEPHDPRTLRGNGWVLRGAS